MQLANAAFFVGLSCSLVPLCGCAGQSESKTLPTVPVKGRVVFTKGGDVKALAVKQGRIEFESVDKPGVRAVGPIEEDGSFALATVTDEGAGHGAIAGTHRVRLDLDDNARRLVAPQFLEFGTSGIKITVPTEQPLEIKVWR